MPLHLRLPPPRSRVSPPAVLNDPIRSSRHEDAHGVAYYVVGSKKIEVTVDGRGGGECRALRRRDDRWGSLVAVLAGDACDHVLYGQDEFDENSYDRVQAGEIAAAIDPDCVEALLDKAWIAACDLVRKHAQTIKVLGHILNERGSLDEGAIRAVMERSTETKPMPPLIDRHGRQCWQVETTEGTMYARLGGYFL